MSIMSIEDIVYPSNWKAIVRTLKWGPDFGIHGTEISNLMELMDDAEKGCRMICHYYAVGKEEKEMDDRDFYDGLWTSINNAINISCKYSIEGSKAVFSGLPCLIFGIDAEKTGIMRGEENPRGSGYYKEDGREAHTFKAGYCFAEEIQILPIVLFERELAKVNKMLAADYNRYTENGTKIPSRINGTMAYLAGQHLTTMALKKFYRFIVNGQASAEDKKQACLRSILLK